MHFIGIIGIKSKVGSLTETVDDTNSTIICIVETLMPKEEEITIPGYEKIFREDVTNNSGGIVIAVKNNIKIISMQIQHEKSIGQALLAQIENQKTNINVGEVYPPQESNTI